VSAPIGLRVEELSHVYSVDGAEVFALQEVDLEFAAGGTTAILGPSGSGKSTLLTLLAGLQRPTSGRILLDAANAAPVDLTRLPERDLLRVRAEQLSVVVQNPVRNLLPYGDAQDNIRFAQRGPRSYARRRALPDPAELLAELGLDGLRGTRADQLSGGERQRLALALGVAAAPGVLLVDEPTSQLDARNRDRVTELLTVINQRLGTTIIAVTHDPEVAAGLGRSISISEGRITADRRR
jgi:ABC-type lipoprotein export system ATPase subunit